MKCGDKMMLLPTVWEWIKVEKVLFSIFLRFDAQFFNDSNEKKKTKQLHYQQFLFIDFTQSDDGGRMNKYAIRLDFVRSLVWERNLIFTMFDGE